MKKVIHIMLTKLFREERGVHAASMSEFSPTLRCFQRCQCDASRSGVNAALQPVAPYLDFPSRFEKAFRSYGRA